jgi:hypothetical protein
MEADAMITVRQIERAWSARTYEKLFRELAFGRAESVFRMDHDAARALPAAAMAVIRLDELSQSHVSLCGKLLRAVLAAQDADGGWGDAMITALCLRALSCSEGDGVAIQRGLAYLANLQKAEGIWPAVPLRRMPADALVSAFVLYELAGYERFRDAVRFEVAVHWFEQNEPKLDPRSADLWHRARHRCRSYVNTPVEVTRREREPMLSWS